MLTCEFQNWPFAKKARIVAVLFLAMFVGFSAPFCGQLNLNQQAALYHKTVVQITYFVSINRILRLEMTG
jgi:hypothetical protein